MNPVLGRFVNARELMTPVDVSILRIFPFAESAKNRWPAASLTKSAATIFAAVAGPPSPESPTSPVPAIVDTTPAALIRRMRVPWSAKYTSPCASTTSFPGDIAVAVAARPSPSKKSEPVPAMLRIKPVDRSTRRMKYPSTNKTSPLPATARPPILNTPAFTAGPPSPSSAIGPDPATDAMTPGEATRLFLRDASLRFGED